MVPSDAILTSENTPLQDCAQPVVPPKQSTPQHTPPTLPHSPPPRPSPPPVSSKSTDHGSQSPTGNDQLGTQEEACEKTATDTVLLANSPPIPQTRKCTSKRRIVHDPLNVITKGHQGTITAAFEAMKRKLSPDKEADTTRTNLKVSRITMQLIA